MTIRMRMIATVTAVTAIALGAAFAVVTVLFIRAQLREADALLLRVAKTEAREVAEQDLSFNAGPGPAQSDVGPMVMAGVLYDANGHVHEATKPFERVQPHIQDIDHPDSALFDFPYKGQHFRGVLTRPNGHPEMRMLIAESREELDADERFLVRAVLTAFLMAVAWAAAVASWRAAVLTREQRAITETVREFAQGKLDARVAVKSSDPETAQLSSDINDMASRIGSLMAAQKRFIAHAAHELRSPLTKLYGELQLALRKERSAADYRRAIEEAEGATRQLKHLADDLLTLARAQGAEENGVAESSDIDKLVRDAVALVRAAEGLDDRRVDIKGESCIVHGRTSDLVRLLRNLLENAAMHSPPGGRVLIEWDVADRQLELRVSDEGEGVPTTLRDRIFEPFFRASRAPGGTGLGLGIARDIARAHGGDLILTDTAGGATFLVTLPTAGSPSKSLEPRAKLHSRQSFEEA
jgi:two-component system heavy metal sensor histidine kinase CusS